MSTQEHEERSPPSRNFQNDHELLMHVWDAQDRLNERLDALNTRLGDIVAHPAPSPGRESLRLLQALVATSMTVALASLAATITAISLLVNHIVH